MIRQLVSALGIVCLTAGLALAQGWPGPRYSDGPEPRHAERHYGGGWNRLYKGFCYSGRQQTCSTLFERPSRSSIAEACRQQGWHRFYAFEHGREARQTHAQVCVPR